MSETLTTGYNGGFEVTKSGLPIGWSFQLLPGGFRQVFHEFIQVRHRVDAQYKRDAFLVPAIQVRGLSEVRIAATGDLLQPRLAANSDRSIQGLRGPLMAGTVSGTIDEEQVVSTMVPSASITAFRKNSWGCCRHTLSRKVLTTSISCTTCDELNRRQKSPTVVGLGIFFAPSASRYTASLRRSFKSSRHVPPASRL